MKILMINKFLYLNGGAETYMFQLGRYLESIGNEVQYFGMEHEGRFVGNRMNVYTTDMDFHGGSKLSKLAYPIKTIYSREARKKLQLVLEDFQPDVCHLNNFNYQLTPSIIVEIVRWRKKNRHPCRIVYTAHDYQLVCPNHMLYNPNIHQNCEQCLGGHFLNCVKKRCIHGSLVRSAIGSLEACFWNRWRVYRYLDAVICPSDFVKSKLDTNPLLKQKTVTLYNFVERSHESENDGEEGKGIVSGLPERYVLYFGRYSEEKGIRTLIRVCYELPDISFVFAGSGPLKDELRVCANVTNIGFQRGAKLKRLIKNAAFCVCPSEWYEAYGLTNAEAVELGTPVLASAIGGIPEVVKEHQTGELFGAGNEHELAQKISELWNSPETLASLKVGCRENSHIYVDQYVEMLCKAYL